MGSCLQYGNHSEQSNINIDKEVDDSNDETILPELLELDVFKNDIFIIECKQDNNNSNNNASNHQMTGCKAFERLISSLKRYEILNITGDTKHFDDFISFMTDIYHSFLDDMTHLQQKHDDLQQINEEVTKKQLLASCNILKCAYTSRHYLDNYDNEKHDKRAKFYKSAFDGLHYYFLHLFETGMRTQKMNDRYNNNISNDNTNEYFDAKFTRIAGLINERRYITKAFDRFKNNKFSIDVEDDDKKDESTTVMDELYLYLLANNINKKTVHDIEQYINDEQYDTDCLKIGTDSPLFEYIQHISVGTNVVQIIEGIIKASKIKSVSFNVGIIFYYWPKYKGMEQFDQNKNKYNINDHGGNNFIDLYVERKYASFKEEISNYKHFNMWLYDELVVKINEYLKTETVKKMKAEEIDTNGIKLEYEIPKNSNF
eukprot:494998_1